MKRLLSLLLAGLIFGMLIIPPVQAGFLGNKMSGAGQIQAAFSPKNIANLSVWLEARAIDTDDSNATKVDQWIDKSGNGNNCTQTTGSIRPYYPPDTSSDLNGYRPVLFNGTDNKMDCNTYTPPASITVFSVATSQRVTTTNSLDTIFSAQQNGAPWNGPYNTIHNSYASQVMTYASTGNGSTRTDWMNGQTTYLTHVKDQVNIFTSTYSGLTTTGVVPMKLAVNATGTVYGLIKIHEFLVYNRVLTTTERQQVESYLSAKYGIPTANTTRQWVVADGDSMTETAQTAGLTWLNILKEARSNLGAYRYQNEATSGHTLNQMDSGAGATVDAIDFAVLAPGGTRILVVWGGTNDMAGGDSAATAYADLRAYVQHRAGTGKYNRILICTAVPRSGSGVNTKLNDFNNLIRSNWSTELAADGATNLVDLAANSPFNDFTNNNGSEQNTTYYRDLVHLTDLGNRLIAEIIRQQLATF
ncbi:MAG: SGNH/GDSL hydrolase family protein [Candidatus Melainabacteria bacterium]